MIYVKHLNFCFVRIPKNASTSVMYFLYKNVCREEDVVSRMYEWQDNQHTKFYYKNCPVLPHSHVDSAYLINNNIVPASADFYGVLREPLEKLLSLYLYRLRTGDYGRQAPSPEHFASLFTDGIFRDTPQQIQPQHTFLPADGTFWLYDNIENHLTDFCNKHDIKITTPIEVLNKSPGNTKTLIKYFYTNDLIDKIKSKYIKDFDLYAKIKDSIT